MLTPILVAAVRARADFDGSNALTWLLLAGFVAAPASAGFLSVTMDRRRVGGGATGSTGSARRR